MTDRRCADALLHPLVLFALAVWLVNDHWAKAAHPGLVTGKLSDLAGLIVFPLMLCAALELAHGRPAPRTWLLAALIATGAAFAAINLLDPAAWLYRHGLALAQWPAGAALHLATSTPLPTPHPVHLTMDPTDLLTLPSLLLPWWLVTSPGGARSTGP